MAKLYFSNDIPRKDDVNIFFASIPPVHSKRMLLEELSNNLKFPDYFGFNWDALYDLLCELYGIEEKTIVVFHESVKNLPVFDLSHYLEIIQATCDWWSKCGDHSVFFVFNYNEKEKIYELLPKSCEFQFLQFPKGQKCM